MIDKSCGDEKYRIILTDSKEYYNDQNILEGTIYNEVLYQVDLN